MRSSESSLKFGARGSTLDACGYGGYYFREGGAREIKKLYESEALMKKKNNLKIIV